ncbi:MAG: aminopeptidase [Opitutaceae bacterium]|nr:aminopeptidase [Opitutaceae bacterium]|tara:strand:- start:319 stop:1434 length:1116 start_codon:yes stop_codon:yes gene_type:complete
MDSRYFDLAKVLTGHSTKVKKGEKVLIETFDVPDGMVIALIRIIRKKGGIPFVTNYHAPVTRELLLEASDDQYAYDSEIKLKQMQGIDIYIALRGANNIFDTSDVPGDRMQTATKHYRPVQDYRVQKTRWVVLRWPTSAMAQQAQMSTEAFEDFYFRVCTMDYGRMTVGMDSLKKLMDQTDKVEIKGEGTDLRFSIAGIDAITCGGDRNIPDGEVFSCPVKDSVEGVLQFNAPTVYQGTSFDNIRLVFEKGKVVEATGSNTARLNEILDTDAGARYIGEFSLGFNPYITHPMRDILFDEKIAGSFHFTPGQAYEEADNGNRSQIHWDMVCIQTPEFGGGEVWFDGELIRKDGQFVPEDLQQLNPEYLLAEN